MKINKKWLLSVRTRKVSERIHLVELEKTWDAPRNIEKYFSKLLTQTCFWHLGR